MPGFFRTLLNSIFGPPPTKDLAPTPTEPSHQPSHDVDRSAARAAPEIPTAASSTPLPRAAKRPPYIFQIGLDFGTAYSKCVVRDVGRERAYVFVPSGAAGSTLPFLIPSRLVVDGARLRRSRDYARHYGPDQISLLKLALVASASGQANDPSHRAVLSMGARLNLSEDELPLLPHAAAIILIGSILAEVRADLRNRLPDYGSHSQDFVAVNMALPVADMREKCVRCAFEKALTLAWRHIDRCGTEEGIDPKEVIGWIRSDAGGSSGPAAVDECHVLPEVSANVHGYVRSRSSLPGMFVISDTGAGTVDQSVFFFTRSEEGERLAYLDAQVIHLGSSEIERRAAHATGTGDPDELERLRRAKESGLAITALDAARAGIRRELAHRTLPLLARVKTQRLHVPEQIFEIQVMYAGGGHVQHPYESGVMDSFRHQIFPLNFNPPAIGLPTPRDLELPKGCPEHAYRRLSVAYGLAFPRADLPPGVLPNEIPEVEFVPPLTAEAPHFVSKDDC